MREPIGWVATSQLRFVRRPVYFEGGAEPAFRLILQQKWEYYDTQLLVPDKEEWRDIPTVNEPPPAPVKNSLAELMDAIAPEIIA